MLKERFVLIISVVSIFLIFSGCSIISSLSLTPTPVPPTMTATAVPPTVTPTPVPPTSTATPVMPTATHTSPPPTATATPKQFAIQSSAFEADILEYCNTDIAITDAEGDSIRIEVLSGTLSIRDGRFAVWCYGAKHTWVGVLTYGNHTFNSDKDNPLQFTIDKDKGYVYIKGKGSVKLPDGQVIELP